MNKIGVKGKSFFQIIRFQRGLAFGVIIVAALIAFEIFNYSTTDFALTDLLGRLEFIGIRWATILAIAFCGMDFAGIARLFTPEDNGRGSTNHSEVWYLFGAWLLAATMNAMLTWWGVSLAILNHETLGNAVVGRETLLRVVPVFVAVLVWLIRVLIIGTFSVAGDRLFSQGDQLSPMSKPASSGLSLRPIKGQSVSGRARPSQPAHTASTSFRPAPKTSSLAELNYNNEPTYHPLSMGASSGMRTAQNARTAQGVRASHRV